MTETRTRTSTFMMYLCASSTTYTKSVRAVRSIISGTCGGQKGAMWRSVGLRAWPAVMGGVERRQSSWGWGVGWSESENAVEKTSGGSRGSRARGKTCSVPVRGFCDGVAGGGVECRARFDRTRAPVQRSQFRRSVSLFSHLSREGVVPDRSRQKQNRASVGIPIPRVPQADARRSHPTDHPGLGWAHSPGAERGRWVSPRGRAPQSAPPATTGLTQATAARPLATGLWRSVIFVVGLMMSVQRHR